MCFPILTIKRGRYLLGLSWNLNVILATTPLPFTYRDVLVTQGELPRHTCLQYHAIPLIIV